ncbi:MAG: hypothetical protein IAE92_06325 [Burkholderiaceae bacterium]|nr:hypothetical protein [Burkholderiaceae bacterium]
MHNRFSMFIAGAVLSSLVALLTGCGGGDGPAIKAIPQFIQFGAPPTLALNGTATVTATASSGLPVSYSSVAPEVCAVNEATGQVNNFNAGTCLIAADQPGNNDFAPAPQATQSLVVAVNPAQTLQWAPPPALALFGQALVSATASSGLPVMSYSSKTPALCTVHSTSGLVTSLTSGDCTIAADQSGDSHFDPAPQVLQILPVAAWSGPLTVPGAPTEVAATLGATADSAVVRFLGPASSGGSPVTGYTVVSVPAGFSSSGAASPVVVACPSGCAGYGFAVVASNAIGNSVPSAAADLLTGFKVTARFFEPDTQPNDTIFTGSFFLNSTRLTVSGLSGQLTESMTGPPMLTVPLVYQLASSGDGQGGLLVSSFSLNTTNVFAGGGFPTGSEGLYYGWPTTPNPGAPGGVGNSYVTIYVNSANPLAPLDQSHVNKLVYGDCAPGGMMGDTCMTGYVGWGTMGGYPVSQTITRQ